MAERINKPITVTLTPESIEGIDILKKEWREDITSRVVDAAIRDSVSDCGYTLIPEEEKNLEGIKKEDTMLVEVICNGAPLKKIAYEGNNYIQAPLEGEYTIRITNNHWKKRLAVIAVDGVNILDGEKAGFAGSGYMLHPWQTIDINGWHRTSEETAAFTFEKLKDSYASKTGHDENNIGVIGIAVFDEKEERPTEDYWRRTLCSTAPRHKGGNYGDARGMSAGSFFGSVDTDEGSVLIGEAMPCAASAGDDYKHSPTWQTELGRVGTGYGERKSMRTREVTFERASEAPSIVLSYRYATKQNLVKWGVIQESQIPEPNPFPAEVKVGVKPPPGWKG